MQSEPWGSSWPGKGNSNRRSFAWEEVVLVRLVAVGAFRSIVALSTSK